MAKKNCWEVKLCGREQGGKKVSELGVCPASNTVKADGVNNGKNGGRACWVIAGTLCEGKVQGIFSFKNVTCKECDFYKQVKDEEGEDFKETI
ncbi:MAG: hypothetical protein KKH98_06425 [Spirochaetes bacterium]|nr:hypothetical protein [Spirochaetota bacterium]